MLPHAQVVTGPRLMVEISQGRLPAVPSELDIPEALRDLLRECWDKCEERRPTASACLQILVLALASL